MSLEHLYVEAAAMYLEHLYVKSAGMSLEHLYVKLSCWNVSGAFICQSCWNVSGAFICQINRLSKKSLEYLRRFIIPKLLQCLRCSHLNDSIRSIKFYPSSCWNVLGALFSPRAMVLGSFQFRGVLLLWPIVGQGPAVLIAGAGQVGCFYVFFFLFFFHLVYPIFPFQMPHLLGNDRTELKYCGLGCYNPVVVVSYYWRRAHWVMVICLEGLSLPRNGVNE